MTPTDTIPVTLEAQAWNQVLTLLAEGPYRVAAPLIQRIQEQCNQWDRVHGSDNVVPMNEAGE
jgi:hypothetical protein